MVKIYHFYYLFSLFDITRTLSFDFKVHLVFNNLIKMSHVNETAESIKSIESAAESILEKETEMLLSEQPKIDVSIKNFIAYFMGQQATSPGDCKGSLPEVVKICQTLLKHIQSIELPPTSIWGEQVPQGDSQSSFDRMNQITRYKVIHMIRKRTIDNGNKISKIFGFSYIKDTGIWSKLKSTCLDALQSNELAIEVLDLFESSFPNCNRYVFFFFF